MRAINRLLVNYFGSVAICVDWKTDSEYIEPKIRMNESMPTPDKMVFKPSLEDCFKVFTAKVILICLINRKK